MVRYAVVGLGYIAQIAVLPAFKNAKKNSVLAALVSGDPEKLQKLGKKYGVKKENQFLYSEIEECFKSGEVDAVYICTPNTHHQVVAELAAQYKIHVLCEKPMAPSSEDCLSMIDSAEANDIQMMIAYRLHFESANLEAIKIAKSQSLGHLRVFNATFTAPIQDENNIRLKSELAGGPLYDIGIYCINAARYLYQEEPIEVFGMSASSRDPKFHEVDESTTAVLRFPNNKLATFTCSFGAAGCSSFDLVGSTGRLHLENAFDFASPMELTVVKAGKTTKKKYPKRDQFAPELIYFSDCILKNKEPEPSGSEGLADVRIIEALLESIELGQTVSLLDLTIDAPQIENRPSMVQNITRPGIPEPKLMHAKDPSHPSK